MASCHPQPWEKRGAKGITGRKWSRTQQGPSACDTPLLWPVPPWVRTELMGAPKGEHGQGALPGTAPGLGGTPWGPRATHGTPLLELQHPWG